MKNSLLLALLGLFILSACQNNEKDEAEKDDDTVTLVEETEVDELPNYSDLDMDEAIEAFSDGDNTTAANYIRAAVLNIKEEGKVLSGNEKVLLDKSIANLNSLAEKVEKGEVTDIKVLDKVFANAEMNVAHAYLAFTSVYAIETPEKAKTTLQNAITRMENATAKLKGEAKMEADKLIAESKILLKKEEMKAKNWNAATRQQINALSAWLEKNVVK